LQANRTNNPATPTEIRLLITIGAALLLVALLQVARSSVLRRVDFAVPYTGGLILRDGNARRMYDLNEQARVQEELLKRNWLLLDAYPPFHALVFAPLTFLGYRAAYIIFGCLNILLWVLFWYLLRNRVGSKDPPFRYLVVAYLFFPLWVAILQGQFSVLVLIAFTLAFLLLRDHRDLAAGFALGLLGLIKFQVVLPFALIFLLGRRWKFMAGIGAAAALLTLVSWATVGFSGVQSYVSLLIDTIQHPANPVYSTIKPWNMPTIRGFVLSLARGVLPQRWTAALAVVLSVSLMLLILRWWRGRVRTDDREAFELMFSASVVVSVLSTPYLYAHDLTPLLLPIVLVVASRRWRVKSGVGIVLVSAIVVLYASPLYLSVLVRTQTLYLLAPVLAVFAVATAWLIRPPPYQGRSFAEVVPGGPSEGIAIPR
jgi:hypothetical protein